MGTMLYVMMVGMLAVVMWCMPGEAANRRDQAPSRGSAMQKLARGVKNIVTGPVEIVREVRNRTTQGVSDGQYGGTAAVEGVVVGIVPGTAKAGGRMLSGLYDVITFPIDYPTNYGSIIEPESVFDADYWNPPLKPGKSKNNPRRQPVRR